MLTLLYLAVAALALGALSFGGAYLARRAAESKVWSAFNRAWVVIQAVVSHVEAKVRPRYMLAAADGRITPAERTEIQAEALRLAREALADQLPAIAAAFRLGTPSAVDIFLSGLIERAHAMTKSAPAAAPSALVVAPPAVVAPVVPR